MKLLFSGKNVGGEPWGLATGVGPLGCRTRTGCFALAVFADLMETAN